MLKQTWITLDEFFMIFLKTGGKERPNISTFVQPNIYIYIYIIYSHIGTLQGIIYRTFTRLHPLLSTPPYVHVYAYASWYAWAQRTNGSLGPETFWALALQTCGIFRACRPTADSKIPKRCPCFICFFFSATIAEWFLQVPTEVGTRRIGSVGCPCQILMGLVAGQS